MWDWDKKQFRLRSLDEEPELAAFALRLVAAAPGAIDVNRSILSHYRMRALPLIEWDLSPDVPLLFGLLSAAGATRGFFIDYPGAGAVTASFRECDLTSVAADAILEEDLFGSATIFVDDLFLVAVAAWFTDLTYLCMSPAMFDQYLAAKPLFLDLDGDCAEVAADRFQAALRGAFRRLDDWSPTTSPVRAALDWQLIRTA